MSPRREAALFWRFIQRRSTPYRGRFGLFRTPNSELPKTVRILSETPVRIDTEISVRNDFRNQCPNNSETPVRLTPKYAEQSSCNVHVASSRFVSQTGELVVTHQAKSS